MLAVRGGQAAPETPFVIEHREALIYMLCEAAELEHGIMCQYLFAAFSLKDGPDEGLNAAQREAVARWKAMIARVATQEMLHLALVQNLLSAIGAAPHLVRPNLPAPAGALSGRSPTRAPALTAKVLSRFPRTLDNLTQALEFVDHAFVFDNSSADEPFRFVAEFGKGILVRRGTCRPTWAIPLLKRFSKKRR